MNKMTVIVAASFALAASVASAANGKADRPQPLDPEKSAKYVEFQGGLVLPPDNGKRIVVWDATGKAGAAVTAFTNTATKTLSLPFVVRTGAATGSAYKAAAGAKNEKAPAVILISEAGDEAPALSVYPEAAIGCVNYSALTGGDEKTTTTRVEKELFRAMGFALGAYKITRTPCVMDIVYSRDELDANPTMLLSPMRHVGLKQATEKLQIPVLRRTLYSQAVREGWAPAPTNDRQKVIWDKAHEVPKSPMKIDYDPNKGR